MKQIRKIFNETPKMLRVLLLLIYDAIAVAMAEFLALLTRFEFSVSQITPVYLDHALCCDQYCCNDCYFCISEIV